MLTKLEIKMKGILLHFSTCLIMLVVMTGCGNLTKSKKTAVTDGQMLKLVENIFSPDPMGWFISLLVLFTWDPQMKTSVPHIRPKTSRFQ
jgi:hypothetical protein